MAEFDYLGAKQAGASDEEIQSFLKANGTDFDLIGAKQAGATDDEISTFLKSQPVKKKEVSKPTTQVSSNGTTKTSQSSYNLDLSLPKVNPNPNNKALPGLGKPLNAKDNILGKGTTVTETPKKPIKENPYFVDVTDKSKDNSTTQADKQAQIQSDINTGKLDENNIATYRGASKLFSDKAVEVTGKNDAQSLIEYGKVAGVDDDLVNRLDDGDKTLFQNQEQLKNLYEQRDILSKSDEQTQKSNITEINKSIAEIEKNNALLYTKRNSDIDAQILDLQKQLNTGVKTITVSTGNGTLAGQDGLESGATEQQTISLNDNEKTLLKTQIQSLQKRKGAYLQDATNPKEVYQDLSPKIKMYEEKNIIPKDASVVDKLKIYYGVKLTQLNELKKRSDIENDYNLGSFGNALVQSVKQRFVDDKTTKSINEIETELNSIAPIIAINADPNAKKKGFFSTLGNSVVDNLTQTTNLNQTSQEKALAVSNAMQKVGVELSKDRIEELNTQIQNKDFGQRKEKNADMLGSTTAFMVDFGVTSLIGEGILSGAAKLAKLALSPKAVVALNVGKTALEETKIGRLAINVAEEGVKYEIVGDINRVIENDATFSQGASGALGSKLGEKTAEKLAMFLGKSASPFVKLVFDTLGRTGVELFEETAQNTDQLISEISGKNNFVSGAVELFKNSDKGEKFVDSIKKQYGNIDDDVDFVLQLAAMSTAFNVGKFGSYFKDLALQKRNELSETEKEQYDVIVHDMQSEVKDVAEKTVSEISDAEKKSPEEVAKTLVTGQSTAKDGSSTITKVETEIANKINKGQELTAEETDYYNAKKDSIDKLVTVNKSPIVPINETVEVEKKEIVLPPPTPQVVAPAELDEQQITEQLNEVLNDKTTPTPLVNTEQEQNISERLPSEYQNNQGVQQINGIGQDVSNESEVPVEQKQAEVIKKANPRIAELPKKKKEVPTEKVEEGVGETESIKNRSRKDLFPDESEFSDVIGGSGKNSKISSYKEVNGIGISEYKNPDSGVVDVIMTGTSDNDYVGYVRIYENGKPTERWTSKMENKSGNKANFKTMISEVKNLLPANHEYTESTNISLDGIRVYANNLTRGYEILTDKDGNPITNNVELNGATLQGLKDAKSDRDVSKLYNKRTGITRDEFNKIREKVNELLPGTRLLFNEANGSVIIKLPVLKSKETAKSNPTDTPEVSKPVSEIAKTPISKTETTAILDEIKSKNLTHVKGKNMGENQALGTFISTEKGNRYETADNKAESVEVDIKNPLVVENDLGLVGKRTEILNNNKDQFTKEDAVDYQELPNGKITLDDLNDAGIKKLAKITTEKLQADGYDGIYFKESKTQEGELVVFDKEKVKFKEQTPIADETPKLKAKEKQDLVKSLNKEQVKEFIKLKTPQERIKFLSDLKNANNKEESKSDKNNEDEQVLQNNISDVLSTKTEEITPKSSIEVDRNVDRIDNSQENIEISSSKKLKTNGSVEEGHSGVFGEDIVDNKGNIVGSKISDTRPNGGKYYQTLVDDTPENRKGFGWQEHQDIDGKIFKKFETLDDLEKFIDSKKEQLKEAPISKTETTENPALKDVESTAKALSELPKETLRDYQYGVDMENFRESLSESDKKDWDELMSLEFDKNANKKRVTELRDKFKPLEQEWFSENDSNPQRIAEQYHENKINGTNPDYVKAVEEALSNKQITNEEQSTNAEKGKKAETVAEISPNKNVSASKASAIKDLIAENYSDLKEMEAGVLANLDGTELVDDLLDYVNWNRATQKGGKFKAKGLKGSAILKLAEKGYIEEPSFTDDNITLTDKGKKFQEALKARQETRKAIKEGTDLFPNDANLQSTDKNFTPISKSKFNELLDKLKKAFPNVKVELFGKNDFDNARKELEKRGIVVTDTKTKDGTIYGFKTPDGKVFLNSDAINANTPIHEFGHIWQSVFPNEFAKGISLLVQSPQGRELINEIRKNPAYKGKSITEIQSEALVTAIGNKGETIFNSNPTLYNKFKQWLNDLFAKIGEKLGIKNLSPDDKFDMFTKKVVGELLGGKVLDSKVGTEKSTEKTITFQGQNIKVKEINGGAEVVNGFYSPLEKIINETKFEKLPAKQWVDKFAKGEEAKWTGLTDWLNQQQGSVSKADIQQYLKDNRIQVVEVVKGGEVSEAEIDVLLADETGEGMTRDEAREYLSNDEDNNQTKFSQYQLEGEKSNYKEVLVTMPTERSKIAQRRSELAALDRERPLTESEQKEYDNLQQRWKKDEGVFKSSHFDEPNILVHLRMNTRTDADGNKVLFLEEVQSDWGQKGKKEGFVEKPEPTKWMPPKDVNGNKVYTSEKGDFYIIDNGNGNVILTNREGEDIFDGNYKTVQEAKNATNNEASQFGVNRIPTAPFVTDTNSWTKLGLKVALKEAVKQGADKIAWTTGEQQNDRYDLSKQVDEIIVKPNDDNTYSIKYKRVGDASNTDGGTLQEKDLEGALGKEITSRILDDKKNNRYNYPAQKSNVYTGNDLKVGGKGMKGFYGSPSENSLGIVGNVAKSLFKQEPKTVEISIGNKKQNNLDTFLVWLNDKYPNKKYSYSDAAKMFREDHNNWLEYEKQFKDEISTQHSIDITPEMKAMVELGQPLFQFKPDELTKKVQELRDFELTDSEIRDYLLEAGNTKQQIDDALGVKEVEENKDETKKELSDSKQRVAERIVLGNSTLNAVKEHIVQQGYDKSDYDSKQIFKDVDELINKFGIEKAESFIDKIGDVGLSEPHKVVLQHKIAEYYGNKALSDETLTEEERKEAMFKSAQLFLDLSEQRTDAGRGNAILAQIYLDSDIYFTLPMFENKMNAIGAQLSGAEKIELENLQNEIKELRKENTKLQELAKKEAEQQIVDDITTHLLVDDLIIDSKIKDDLEVKNAKSILAKGFEDIARMLSSIAMAQQVDKVKFKDTILDMTKATMTISKIGVKKALKSVIKAIKNANQNIDEKLLEDAEKHVLSKIKETDTGIKKKNKEGISKDELIELIEQGADTMEKMVEAIRDKYYDGDKSISDKQIRDEITNYGNSIRQSQTQVEEKLSEIKSLMLLQSKLEDAENNVAPKKTGFIRDKDKIAVREKRRELAEAMKKLTVTLSEDDIAGLNERKLTQIANKIEEVQKVLDGYEKIKNKANFDYNDAVKKKQQELDDLMSSQKALLHYAKENLTNLVAKYQDKLDKKQYSKNPTLNKLSITDSEYQKLKNQLEAKKEQLKSERDNFRNNNADYLLENRQKQIDRQIVEIDNLLAGIKVRKTSEQIKAEKDRKAGVINSSTNQTALDKLKENQKVLEAKKEQWERKVIQKEVEIEKAKQTWLQKLGINAMSISRTLTLGFTDIGWLGVQGGYFARTKPHLFAKALKESFKGKLSEEAFNQWKRDLKSNPFYETMIKAGLRIPSQSLRDDIFEQEFRESGFTKLLGKNEVTDIVNKNARLSVKFLANLRIQVFQKMYNGLTESQKADKEVLEKLADYVNSRSGAGQVIGEDNKRGLNKWWSLLTSARNTSAMLQQTYIGMLYGLAKNYVRNKPLSNQPIIARQLVNDLLNQAVLFSGLYLSYLVANGLSGDDDEWNVETSPFSTNFLKLKNKEGDRSYFDMGGMTALNVATLRLLTTITNAFGTDFDNFKDYKGEYSKVGLKDFSSKTGLQILSESIFNRTLSLLAPIKNPFTAKSDKDGNYSMYGKTYTPTEFKLKMLMDMFIPMNLPNIYNDITDKDVNALNAIVNTVLNVIGVSNQNQKYDRPEDSTSPQVNSVPVKSTPVSSMPIVPRPVK